MLSSIARPARSPQRGRHGLRPIPWRSRHLLVLSAILAVLVVPVWAPAPAQGAAVAAVTPRCLPAVAGPPSPDVPWPQQRYDMAAVGQLSTGTGVVVAVIDSGVDAVAPQLSGAVVKGADPLGGGDGREDCKAHGTAVASIIAARPLAGAGLRGLAPGVTILPVRVSERTDPSAPAAGTGGVAELVAGIRSATVHQPKPAVINLSISTTTDNPSLRSAIADALAADIVVVAAAGNEHDHGDPTPYPAAYDGVVGVGAIAPDSTRVASSQVGSYVDIVAPGTAVVGALPTGGYGVYEGTSFATPFVAATAALIRSRWPNLHQADVVRRLLATTDPAPGGHPSPEYGYGILDPRRALTDVVLAAGAAPSAAPLPVFPPVPARPATPPSPALAVAAILVLAAAGVATVAAAVPAGRRRRWRPGAP